MKKGWEIKKLGEVCEINGGSTPLKTNSAYWENGTKPWFTVDDIREQGREITYTQKHITELAYNKLHIYPIDTILLCCTASVGEYAITKIELSSNQQFNGLSIKDKKYLLPKYLFYFASTLKEQLLKLSGKTTIDFVSATKLKNIEIPVPPLAEQERIVAMLDAAFAKIDALKANALHNLQNAKDLFQQALKQELAPKDGWVTKKLGEVAEMRPSKQKMIEALENDDEVSFLPMEDLQIMNYHIKAKKVRKLYEVSGSYTCFANGDVLLAKVTPCFENGKLGIATDLINGIGFGSSEYIVLRPNKLLSSEFVYFYLATESFRKIGKKRMQGACGLKRLSKEYVENSIIPIPPLSEQQRIVETLNTLSAKCKQLEANCSATIAECDALKQAILRKTINGEN